MVKKPEKKEKMVKNTKKDIAAALIIAGFKRTEKRREEEAKKRRNLGTKPEFGAILPLLNEHEIENLGTGISVKTFDQLGNCYEMIFESYRNSIYKLYNGWKKLLKYHKLKENGDYYAAVWMFRHKENDGLCFALM
uniref:B3 domain-containing protein At4g03170 n=2 Tax=Nicotiana sylvestris TaxID=4096 RepID=A0A1U7VB29_NICSY|nr:PREDICTED: putative B3 domain-containing protein At4g03170 [Nicotiana sylvestris]